MVETYSYGSHVARAIMRADLGYKVRVNHLGSAVIVHHHTHVDGGHWLASIVVGAAQPPIDIRKPDYVFVPDDANRYAMQSNRDVPMDVLGTAGDIHGQLVALRADGFFMTATEVRDVLRTFRDLLTSMREEGYEDVSGLASKAAAMMARHNPALSDELELGSPLKP